MKKLKRFLSRPLAISAVGAVVAGLIVLFAFSPIVNRPQCPDSYTQQQVDTSSCIIGANIGLGLIVFFAGAVLISSMLVAATVAIAQYRSKGSHGKVADSTKASAEVTAAGKGWPSPVVAFVLTIGLFLTAQIFGALIVSLIQSLTGDDKTAQLDLFGSTVALQFVFAFLVYGFLLASVSWYLRRRGIGRQELGLTNPQLSALGYAGIAFIVYVAAFAILQNIVNVAIPGLDLDQKQDTGFGDATGAGVLPLVLTFIALVILAPLAEEVLMRGFLFGSLRNKLPFWVATFIVSSLFAVLHLGGGEAGSGLLWVAAIDTFVLSVVLCYLREKTGRLWASIALHMLKNGIAFVFLFIIGTDLL